MNSSSSSIAPPLIIPRMQSSIIQPKIRGIKGTEVQSSQSDSELSVPVLHSVVGIDRDATTAKHALGIVYNLLLVDSTYETVRLLISLNEIFVPFFW